MDDKNNIGGQDRKRIDINEEYELQYWSEKFGVSRQELKNAVEQAGTEAEEVERILKSSKSGR
jgi:hypothetical protein